MATFTFQPLQQFAGSNTAIRRPREFAFFSYDNEHKFHLDGRSMGYYYTPKIGADLSKGFEKFQKHNDTANEHLESLLKTIVDYERQKGRSCEADIVTWRGMITKIMATPFDQFNDFEMNATKFQDTIFIEENHEHKVTRNERQQHQKVIPGMPSQEMMSYWGYKFEALSVLPDTWDATPRDYIERREDLTVNNKAQYCSVVHTGIGTAKIILGGEIDAIWDCKPVNKNDPINWVELKTAAKIETQHDMLKFERKLLKFWIQSFLLGVPKIIVGFRSKHGILESVEEMETTAIPNRVKQKGMGSWDGNLCINFTASFLEWLKGIINNDGVWRIRKKEKASCIEVFKVQDTGHGDILSQEFLDWRNGNRNGPT